MKKYLFLIGLFLSTNANAGLISLNDFTSGADVTIARLDANFNTIADEINGGLEGGGINIAPGSITSVDMANSISPVKRWDEAFNDFTSSGMLPATSANLTSDISAGVSYVNGLRIQKNATANTYTASKDTYVYISQTGSYVFQEVANGASAPSTPSNSLLLASVVTSGAAITTVNDLRTTSIQITATTTNFPSHHRIGAFASWDSTTTLHLTPGNVAIGTSIYNRTTNTSAKNVTTATNWIEGAYPGPGTPTDIFLYGYNDSGSSFDFKFSSADPVYADTSSNTVGTLRYYTQGGTTYRALGWAYLSNDTVQLHEHGNFRDSDAANYTERTRSTATTFTGTTDVNIPGTEVNFYSTGGFVEVNFNHHIQNTTNNIVQQIIVVDGISRDTSRVGFAGDNAASTTLYYGRNNHWSGRLSQGVHRIGARGNAASGVTASLASQMVVVEI